MSIFNSIEKNYGTFPNLAVVCTEPELSKFCDSLYKKYCTKFANAEYIQNVAWIGRQYLASKKLALSALFYTQAKHLMKHKMKNLSFYACYYAYFNGLSSNLLMNPNVELHHAREISHSALSSQIENLYVRHKIHSRATIELLGDLRFARELYSYHLPLSGKSAGIDDQFDSELLFNRLTEMLPSALELTNLISYLVYEAWDRKVGKSIDEYANNRAIVDDFFHSIVRHDDVTGKRCHYDDGDYQQLGYFLNKLGRPMPISWFINDKILDELECNWTDEESDDGYAVQDVMKYLSNTINF